MVNNVLQAKPIASILIASCGMNCGLCKAYVRERNPCAGCRRVGIAKQKTRAFCKIKLCEMMQAAKAKYCFGCKEYPCERLKHLDKRYRTKYGMSMIENLESIKRSGIRNFVRQEKGKWACAECGGILCVHEAGCLHCGRKWR